MIARELCTWCRGTPPIVEEGARALHARSAPADTWEDTPHTVRHRVRNDARAVLLAVDVLIAGEGQ